MAAKSKKDVGSVRDIRVRFDYRLMRELSQNELDEMYHRAQLVAYDIYERLGWKFHLEKLMVGFAYAKALKSSEKKNTLFFSVDWATSGIADNVNRRMCLLSEQRVGTHSYHSWQKMWHRYKNDTLGEIVTDHKTKMNPLYKE